VRPAVRLGQHPAPVLPQAAGMLVFAVLRVPVLVRVASWVGRTSRLRRSHRSRTPPPARGRPAGPPHRPSAGEEALVSLVTQAAIGPALVAFSHRLRSSARRRSELRAGYWLTKHRDGHPVRTTVAGEGAGDRGHGG